MAYTMSELSILIENIEKKFALLMQKIEFLETEKAALEEKIKLEIQEKNKFSESLERLTKQYESLKITNSLLGSEEFKKETKLKINSLVREIDHCISQLSQ
ncbi:hypothetical protein QW060_12785 [Myroides ceti]|uniref:Uncharacterized protein n=1 Tax=Paenimyroides ceti TaxID=395087 RepID=A0ABT8CVF7_9FLAO|nr:hypothetical protein [Paenimyroides ceti]MDN3707986.1 hypothetical protein [Paenimyroides ceti]